MYKEVNTGTNLPAQIDLYATDGDEYKFLCIAKGGGVGEQNLSVTRKPKALITLAKLKNYPRREDAHPRYCRLSTVPYRLP